MYQRIFLCCCLLFCTHLSWAQLANPSAKTAKPTIGNYSNISLSLTTLAIQDTDNWITQIANNDLKITTETDEEVFYDKTISVGIGIGRLATKSRFKAASPAISVAFDRNMDEMFGVDWFTTGFYIGHASYTYSAYNDFSNGLESTEVIIAGRYGLNISKMMGDLKEWKLPVEVYANLQLGYAFLTIGEFITLPPDIIGSDGLYAGLAIGAAYRINQFSAFIETGKTEAGLLKVGASFSF